MQRRLMATAISDFDDTFAALACSQVFRSVSSGPASCVGLSFFSSLVGRLAADLFLDRIQRSDAVERFFRNRPGLGFVARAFLPRSRQRAATVLLESYIREIDSFCSTTLLCPR